MANCVEVARSAALAVALLAACQMRAQEAPANPSATPKPVAEVPWNVSITATLSRILYVVHLALHDSATSADADLTHSCSRAFVVCSQSFLFFVIRLEEDESE
jgi:hypothetical protein